MKPCTFLMEIFRSNIKSWVFRKGQIFSLKLLQMYWTFALVLQIVVWFTTDNFQRCAHAVGKITFVVVLCLTALVWNSWSEIQNKIKNLASWMEGDLPITCCIRLDWQTDINGIPEQDTWLSLGNTCGSHGRWIKSAADVYLSSQSYGFGFTMESHFWVGPDFHLCSRFRIIRLIKRWWR